MRNELRASIDPPQHADWAAEADRRASNHAPSIWSDLDHAPLLIGEIEIDVAGMLGDADMDGVLRTVELRPRFEQIER